MMSVAPSRIRFRRASFTLLAVLCASCGDDPSHCDGDVGSIATVGFFDPGPIEFSRLRSGTEVKPFFRSRCGTSVFPNASQVTWTSSDSSVASVGRQNGSFSAFVQAVGFGTATISAAVGQATGKITVNIERPPHVGQGFTVVGQGPLPARFTSDLWVHGDYAYTGTLSLCTESCEGEKGWLFVWHLLPDGGFEEVDSLALPARNVNDIKVSADGTFAVASQEAGGLGDNGIVLLDLADPAAPTVLARYREGLDGGVHNVWIERIDGRDYVFVAEDGFDASAGLHIIDVTERTAPVEVAHYYGGTSFVHDVYVRDGLAFVSHWDNGLVILDVGNGIKDGSPDNPVEVGQVFTAGGNVHNAWYWPAGKKVFVGEEQFPPPELIDQVGVVHVVDVSDMENPVEVATIGVPGVTPHNFWMDEERQLLFVGWYTNGLRVFDVSGSLSGELATQGREVAWVVPSGPNGAADIWAPQLHNGRVYLSDIVNGIWSVRLDR